MFLHIKKKEKKGMGWLGRDDTKGVGAAHYSNSAVFHGRVAEVLFELIFNVEWELFDGLTQ